MPADDSLSHLARLIARGLAHPIDDPRKALEALFGDRFPRNLAKPSQFRDAFALAKVGDDEKGVPYAGLINPENPTSGPYGGTSLVWFPTLENGSLISLVVGTRGVSPDEGILMRPGHRRRVAALRRHLAATGVDVWTKPDPASLGVGVPEGVKRQFAEFGKALDRYGRELYAIARVPQGEEAAQRTVQAFLDLYALERAWRPMTSAKQEFEAFQGELRAALFPEVTIEDVDALLRGRRFVILQGPPGTGKTRLADEVKKRCFGGHGMTVQFHPAVTYEDFVVGLAPDATQGSLRFEVRKGWLLEAAERAREGPFVLVVDEVNRADLGKVLGEAIYLFEPGEVGGPEARSVRLPHSVEGASELSLPTGLFVLATMNTADRSIAGLDLAIRRRFAFVTLRPDRSVVAEQGIDLATILFDRLVDVFVEHAPDEALDLMPGHAYFLASSEAELRSRFRHELLPLLDEYLRQGLLGPAVTELAAVRDAVADASDGAQRSS